MRHPVHDASLLTAGKARVLAASCGIAFTLCLHAAAPHAASAMTDPAACSRLSAWPLEHGSITAAALVAEEPGYCLVRGEIGHHVGSDGHAYGDRFELRLPAHWSGRLLFQGGGGLDGVVRPAIGIVSQDPAARIPSALERGYAVVSTDAGHDQSTLASPGDFGADPQALADYEFDSTRVVSRAARAIAQSYYRRAPARTYFMGCSEGGREGLIAAQRYPELFDGIIAGSPAFRLTRVMADEAWNVQAWAAIAPKDSMGRPVLAKALSDAELHLLSAAVLEQCDAGDGAKDGLVGDPSACRFDPEVLACGSADAKNCLSGDKIAAIKKVFSGPKDSGGRAIYSDWFYDTGVDAPGWRLWMLGNDQMPALNQLIAPAAINGMVLANQPPAIDVLHFDFDRDTARVDRIAGELNAVSTDYTRLKKRGGKLLMYVGVSDPVFSARDLVRYYGTIVAANDGGASTREFARLFLVPGMNHCAGGQATDAFDTLGAMESWVEHGKRPDRIIATGAAFPGRTRPLCPFPQVARHSGGTAIESAENFVCR